MRPRLVLAAVAVLAAVSLAGCASSGSLEMQAVDDEALAERASEPATGGHSPIEQAHRWTVRDVVRNGSRVMVGSEPPLRTATAYEYRGRYYNLSRELVRSEDGVETLVAIDYNGTAPNASRVAFGDLSPTERRQLRPFLRVDPDDVDDGPEAATKLAYTDAQRAEAALLAYSERRVVVTFEGRTRVLEVMDVEQERIRTYRYTARVAADTASGYADALTREYAFRLRNLNDSQRSVVEAAIGEGGYYADSDDDAAFGSLVERFRAHPAVESDGYSGTWLVRYRGQRYWAELHYGPYASDGAESVTPPSVTPN